MAGRLLLGCHEGAIAGGDEGVCGGHGWRLTQPGIPGAKPNRQARNPDIYAVSLTLNARSYDW